MAVGASLTLPLGEAARLKRRVAALAENRPAVYRMLDPTGRVIYVGKAKRLRSRLLSYFRAHYPEDKAARIVQAAADLQWDYVPSEFAALLGELRQIHRHHPLFNVRMNRARRAAFIKVSGGPAPKLYVGRNPAGDDVRHYGPFLSAGRLQEAIRALNDLLGLRDCSLRMPIVYRDQGDLFGGAARAGCIRHEIGTCAGPCGALVTEAEYQRRVREALDFIEGRGVVPLDRVIAAMTAASESEEFERATWWRDRFDTLTWLLEACGRMQAALDALTFVYVDPGAHGDDRAYVISRAQVRAAAPAPHTPIEGEAFAALVREHVDAVPEPGPIPSHAIDETLLVLSWFRRHPGTLRHTVPLAEWLARHDGRQESR
jgi:excinuclease ABC subunit C